MELTGTDIFQSILFISYLGRGNVPDPTYVLARLPNPVIRIVDVPVLLNPLSPDEIRFPSPLVRSPSYR